MGALIAFVTVVRAGVRCVIRHRAHHIGQRRTNVVEERTQVFAEQHHAEGCDDGDKRNQKRVLGGDRARFTLRQAKNHRLKVGQSIPLNSPELVIGPILDPLILRRLSQRNSRVFMGTSIFH